MHHFIIVGAGIAGIAIAELLQRSGRPVLLLEAQDKLCSESSAHQQGWFHTGSLYAALPTNSFFRILVGNLDDLFGYYSCFENMNLRVDRNIYTSKIDGWFSNTMNLYAYVSPREPEVSLAMKPLWWLAIQRAQRRLAWFENLNFAEDLSKQVRFIERRVSVNLVKRWGDLGFNLGRLSCVLKSRDRTMDSHLIATDLLRSFLGNGGELKTNCRVKAVEGNCVVTEGGETLRANHVIVTSGHLTGRLCGVGLRIHASPIVVAFPALTTVNFVRMSPKISETINHIYHRAGGYQYSVLGNALYYDHDRLRSDEGFKHEVNRVVLDRMTRVFPDELGQVKTRIYYGIKTEVVNSGQFRNYQYHIIDRDKCTVALPGKFSLAFSLAVNVCKYFGIEPLRDHIKLAPAETVTGLISRQKHYEYVMEMAKSA